MSENNDDFYFSHTNPAEEFVYSDIEWTTVFVADVFTQKRDDKQVEKVKLVSKDGQSISVKKKKLGIKHRKLIGKCYDVKIHKDGTKENVVLIKESESSLEQLLTPFVCYVDYHNKDKNYYHLISENAKDLLLTSCPVELVEKTFCICFEVPEKKEVMDNLNHYNNLENIGNHSRNSERSIKAIYWRSINEEEALANFPNRTAVVDGINESKQLFHCVFGRNCDIIIKYSETQMRPRIGDYLNIRYVKKKIKEGKIIRKMLTVEATDTCDEVLKKTASGPIRLNYNSKGQLFGFVDDYYVPTHLVEGLKEEEPVCVDVVFNGEKWQAYKLVRYNEV